MAHDLKNRLGSRFGRSTHLSDLQSVAEQAVRRLIRRVGFDVVSAASTDMDLQFGADTAETIRLVRPFTLTSPARIAALCDAVRYVVSNRIPGAIVECGVWRGGSMMAVARTLLNEGESDRELYLFDTFKGMTSPSEHDYDYRGVTGSRYMDRAGVDADGHSNVCNASIEDVRQNLTRIGYPSDRIHLIEGPVEDTLSDHAPERIGLLRLDTDWYESTRAECVHLYPRIALGGVLIVDDYGHWQGARKAIDEYISEHRLPLLLQRIDYTGRLAVVVDPATIGAGSRPWRAPQH